MARFHLERWQGVGQVVTALQVHVHALNLLKRYLVGNVIQIGSLRRGLYKAGINPYRYIYHKRV